MSGCFTYLASIRGLQTRPRRSPRQYRWGDKKEAGPDLLHIPDGPDRAVRPGLRKRRQPPKHSMSFIPSRTAPLRSFRRIGHNRPGRHPIHRRTATLIYGQVDMTRDGPPLPGTSAPVNVVRRVPCFRPFSCIDMDMRNVYDYILNFVEQFQHITRQICSPIAARP